MRRRALAIFLTLLCCSVGQAGVIYSISINTAPLIGHPAAPFALEFQLNDGKGTGDANNTAMLTGFSFGGGGPSGSPTLTGGATGNATSGITLTDSSFYNELVQGFTPGSILTFQLSLTTNVDTGGTPDQFSFAFLDKTATEIPTLASFVDVFVQIDITSANPTVQTFASDMSRGPAGGGSPINIAAPVVALVPEPTTILLSVFGLLTLLAWRRYPPQQSKSTCSRHIGP